MKRITSVLSCVALAFFCALSAEAGNNQSPSSGGTISSVQAGSGVTITAGSAGGSGVFTGPAKITVYVPEVDMRAAGAVGDGSADDSAAFATALASGRIVRCHSGDTYLVNGGLTTSVTNQVIDMTGCTVRLKNSASNVVVLTLSGTGETITGGGWDGNLANNAITSDPNAQRMINVAADHVTIDGVYVHNVGGNCVYAVAVSQLAVRRSRFNECLFNAIALTDPTTSSDANDDVIDDNLVTYTTVQFDSAPNHGTHGIISSSSYPTVRRRVRVTNNRVYGPASGNVLSTAAITVRGAESVVTGNIVRGTNLGISVDRSFPQYCVISNNNLQGQQGEAIEVNGAYCSVVGNVIRDTPTGISADGHSAGSLFFPLVWDHMVFSGNVISNVSTGINIAVDTTTPPDAGSRGHSILVEGNSILVASGTTELGIKALHDVQHLTIAGNTIEGPGSSDVAGNGFMISLLDTSGDITITGNTFTGWRRGVSVNQSAAFAVDRINFDHNTLYDVGVTGAGAQSYLLLGGTGPATYGADCRIVGNYTGDVTTIVDDYLDLANNIRNEVKAIDTPQAVVTANVGSTFTSTTTGLKWIKLTGTGNTGWIVAGVATGSANHLSRYTDTNTIGNAGLTDDGVTVMSARNLIAALGYPNSSAYANAAIGYGAGWDGWYLDDASGDLAPAFGGLTLGSNGGVRTYGTPGPLGGTDFAIGFGSADASWDGGANFDLGSANDLIVAAVIRFNTAPSTMGAIVSKTVSAGSTGWVITPNSGGTALQLCAGTGAGCNEAASLTTSWNTTIWAVLIAVVERDTLKMRIGMMPLGGSPAVSTEHPISVAEDFTTTGTFRVGKSPWTINADTHSSIAALYLASGSGIASGLSTNLSTALTSFGAAVQASTTLGAITSSAVRTGGAGGAVWTSGAVAPNSNVIGSPGDLYSYLGGGAGVTLCVKETGSATNTGWICK